MKLDIAKQWVEALRSGKYEQATGQIREVFFEGEVKYCCLGVLCEVLGLPVVEPDSIDSYGNVWERHYIPKVAVDASGLKSEGGLVDLNDRQHASFTTIADYIEQHAEAL